MKSGDKQLIFGMTVEEVLKKGLTMQQAEKLLRDDLKNKYKNGCRQWKYIPKNPLIAEILADYTFNGCGPLEFKKFFAALKICDQGQATLGTLQTLLKQYHRHYTDEAGNLHDMKKRDGQTAKRYFTLGNFGTFCGTTPEVVLAMGFDVKQCPWIKVSPELAKKAAATKAALASVPKLKNPTSASPNKFVSQVKKSVPTSGAPKTGLDHKDDGLAMK